jgi:pimeloyl-ACP methyl ester carboxylesterase
VAEGDRVSAQLHAAEFFGDGGPVIVLLHGFAGHHEAWRPVQQALAVKARVLAYDLPGHGKSLTWPGAVTSKAASRAILADLAARGIERFHLAGHSMGGAIATLMALTEPSHLRSLTLFAPGGFGEEINIRLLRRYAAAKTIEELQACLEAMTGWTHPVDAEAVRAIAAMREAPGQTEKLAEIAASLARGGRQGVFAHDRLAGLPMPVSVAWGLLDPVLPVRQADGLPAHFALHFAPGAGHMLPEEVPELVAALIRRNAGIC